MQPNVQNQTGFIFGQMLNDIGGALEKRKEEAKRVAQAGKAADAFFKAIPQDKLPMSVEEWSTLSPMDKASAMSGIIGAQSYQKGQQDLANVITEQEYRRRQMERVNAEEERLGTFNTAVSMFPSPLPPTGQDIMGMAAGAGVLTPEMASRLLPPEGTDKQWFFNQKDAANLRPLRTEDGRVIPGMFSKVIGPNQETIVVDPTAPLNVQTVTGPEGPTPVVVPTRGAPKFFPQDQGKITPQIRLKALIEQRGNLYPNQTNEMNKIDAEIMELLKPKPKGDERVRVVSPDGKVGTIPASQLEEALRSGYKRQ